MNKTRVLVQRVAYVSQQCTRHNVTVCRLSFYA
jgi:hypothetical protein